MDRFVVERELFSHLQRMPKIDHKMCSTYYFSCHLKFTCRNQGKLPHQCKGDFGLSNLLVQN